MMAPAEVVGTLLGLLAAVAIIWVFLHIERIYHDD